MVKKLVVFLIAAVTVASCLDTSGYSSSETIVASMEYTYADYAQVFGADSIYYDTLYRIGIDWKQVLSFHHKVNESSKEFEGGFMLSYLQYPKYGATDLLSNNKYRANSKTFNDINTYLVFEQTENMPEKHMSFAITSSSVLTATCTMQSCYVNNTVAVAKAVEDCFVPGDKLVLKAKGYLAGNATGTADITLAERSSTKDSIMYTWTQFDLSKLGSIDKVDFELVPETENWKGPMSVCIDNIVASISIEQ